MRAIDPDVTAGTIRLRPGTSSDVPAILEMWDGAIAWMVARGQTEQWGSEPASSRAETPEMVQRWTEEPGLTIAELDREVVGVSVLADSHPDYVQPIAQREHYHMLLLSSRDHAGRGIGSLLVRNAAAAARASGSEVLRVDCWAGAPGLVAWYERQGFERSETFAVEDWQGQVFEMGL